MRSVAEARGDRERRGQRRELRGSFGEGQTH